MISITNNSSATTTKLQAFLSGAAATTNPTVTVVSYIVPPQSKPDFSENRRAPQFTVLAGATETDIADAPPQGSVKDIITVAIYNADTAAVTVTVCIDDNATNRILCKVTLGVASTLHYESERGWYVIDASGANVTSTTALSGSWTPSVGGSATYTAQAGIYTKIGNYVFIQGHMTINSIGTGSTGIISGLPFSSASNAAISAYTGSVSYFATLATNVIFISLHNAAGGATLQIDSAAASTATATTATAVFGNGADIYFSIHYPV